jgi:hypothetical protein
MSAVYADMGSLVNHGGNVLSFSIKIIKDEMGYIVQGPDVRLVVFLIYMIDL